MWSIPIKKFFAVIRDSRSHPRLRAERGQGILEYTLVLMVVLGVIFVLAKPVIAKLQKNVTDNMQKGFFKEDPSGSNFYYFPVK